MDKNTLSHYGKLVAVIIVLAILISLATPFASVIRSGVAGYVGNFKGTALDALNGIATDSSLGGEGSDGPDFTNYNFEYYSSVSKALSDANNGTTENKDADADTAVAALYVDEDDGYNLVLLDDASESGALNVTRDLNLNLNGKNLNFTTSSGSLVVGADTDVTIDGRKTGSSITMNATGTLAKLINATVAGSSLTINGGTYEVTGSYSTAALVLTSKNSVPVTAENCNFVLNNAATGAAYAIQNTGNPLTLNSCNFTVEGNIAGDDLRALFIKNSNPVVVTDCNIDVTRGTASEGSCGGAYIFGTSQVTINDSTIATRGSSSATHLYTVYVNDTAETAINNSKITATGSSATTVYAVLVDDAAKAAINSSEITAVNPSADGGTYGIRIDESTAEVVVNNSTISADKPKGGAGTGGVATGILNYGALTFNSGKVTGVYAGIDSRAGAKTYIYGGDFDSCDHGGLYFCNGSTGEAYVENATIRNSGPSLSAFEQNDSNVAPFYIRSEDDTTVAVYMDNCTISSHGTFGPALAADNTKLYISNCTLYKEGTTTPLSFRIDEGSTLYLGENVEHAGTFRHSTTNPGTVEETDASYKK